MIHYNPTMDRAGAYVPDGLQWSASRQIVYFNTSIKDVCWADKEGDGYYSNGCDWRSVTEIGLCLHHYLVIFGHQPKE